MKHSNEAGEYPDNLSVLFSLFQAHKRKLPIATLEAKEVYRFYRKALNEAIDLLKQTRDDFTSREFDAQAEHDVFDKVCRALLEADAAMRVRFDFYHGSFKTVKGSDA